MPETVRIKAGSEAWEQLESADSQWRWAHLTPKCPWATTFQSLEFVITWFDCV